MEIGSYVMIRSYKTLINLAKNTSGKNYLWLTLNRLVELDGFLWAEIVKVSVLKWQLTWIMTEETNYDLEDDKIFFTADWYDIKSLNHAVETSYYNELMGEQTEYRVAQESRRDDEL